VGAERGILERREDGIRGAGANDHGPPRARHRAGKRRINVAQAYCVKDKMMVEMRNPQKITMKNGKPAMKGVCPKCGTSVFRIGG
jgi:hypothetical protein